MNHSDETLAIETECAQLREQLRLAQQLVSELVKGLGENAQTRCTGCPHGNPMTQMLFYEGQYADPGQGHHLYDQCDVCLARRPGVPERRVEEASFAPALRVLVRWSKGELLEAPPAQEPRG